MKYAFSSNSIGYDLLADACLSGSWYVHPAAVDTVPAVICASEVSSEEFCFDYFSTINLPPKAFDEGISYAEIRNNVTYSKPQCHPVILFPGEFFYPDFYRVFIQTLTEKVLNCDRNLFILSNLPSILI